MNAGTGPIHVLTLADEDYAMPLAVMGRSLLENHHSRRPIRMKIIDGGLTPESRQRVDRSWIDARRSSAEWEWISPSSRAMRNLPVWGRVPALTYARLFVEDYFTDSDQQVLLLDSDTLVLADIADLQGMALGAKIAAACVDPFIPTVSSIDGLPAFARTGMANDDPYFNAGVLVADVRRWREERVGQRSLDYIERQHRHLRQYDQDALNVVLAGRWKKIDDCWNAQPRTLNALGVPLPDRPRIAHFSGRLKPWLYDGGTELDRLFWEYLGRTEWRGFGLPVTWRAQAWRLYDSPIRRVLHGVECRVLAIQRHITLTSRGWNRV